MDITYKNKKIERICTDAKTAERTYGREMADKIHQRIDEICAVDLVHPYRLVFEKIGNEIQIANILEIVDYH